MTTKSQNEAENGKPVINVRGGIHATNVVMGNQTNNITYTSTQIANLGSPAEFMTVLQQVQAQIAEIKKAELSKTQARNLETVADLVLEVSAEAQKPQPALERIQASLAEAKETLELLAGSLVAATALGSTLGGLAVLAAKLFGG